MHRWLVSWKLLRGRRRHGQLRLRQQAAAISQELVNRIEVGQLGGIHSGRGPQLGLEAGALQLQGPEPLLQVHQALGEGRHGLGQIFCGAADPERHGFGHGWVANWWADDTTEIAAAQVISQTAVTPRIRSRMHGTPSLLLYLLAGLGGGLVAIRTGIPAAPLAGALLGAGLVSMSGKLETAQWPLGTRTVLEIAIGTVIGTSLTSTALAELRLLWRPAILITVTLVLTGLVVGLWCSRLLGIDPIVALLGAAPGGISGMSLVGAEFGVGAAVAALHAVRLITVLLVLPLVVRLVLSLGQTPPAT